MASPAPFTIALRRTSYKDAVIEYREPARALDVYIEMSGLPAYDYVGLESSFASWTSPPRAAMSDAERTVVRARIDEWAASVPVRVRFGPAVSVADALNAAIAGRFELTHGTDERGRQTVTVSRTRSRRGGDVTSGFWTRLRRWLAR